MPMLRATFFVAGRPPIPPTLARVVLLPQLPSETRLKMRDNDRLAGRDERALFTIAASDSITMRIYGFCIGIMAGRDLRESGPELPKAFISAKVGGS
jgi:hypothetical protein